MQSIADQIERRTTSDIVYDYLFEAIVSLEILPGTKLSEAEIAKRFGVSRQPVRDAFNRLESQDLLLIRPQKATTVRGFSLERIAHARFVRLAVELEVVHCACSDWQKTHSEKLDQNLAEQDDVIKRGETDKFHQLDYDFHKLICELSGHRLAFGTIQECKRKIDRLCVLSLGRASEATTLYQDHSDLASALAAKDSSLAANIVRRHLARLDDTIVDIHKQHAEYFE
ncbi:MAG: GntR family transcriptional regulator [Ruegeria sp.]